MNFTDVSFWQIVLPGILVWMLLSAGVRRLTGDSGKFDRIFLVALDCVCLLNVSGLTFAIFLLVTLGTYGALAIMLRFPQLKRLTPILLVAQLLPLLYYKYAYFALHDVLHWPGIQPSTEPIPAGLSFYTFQKVAFLIDTLHFGLPLPKLLDYLNFAGFFPQLVAGPIERRADLLPQMERFTLALDFKRLTEGLQDLLLGFFFKAALADNFAPMVQALRPDDQNPFVIWLANACFAFQIYFDFAGYSIIALGLAKIIGIRLTLNFRSPYTATSLQDFWRRWHVTLSRWFRDYVFIPLGGGRCAFWWVNILIVFLVSGIWHGAGYNFILWGAFHGIALVFERQFKIRLPGLLGWVYTVALVLISWLLFYETQFPELIKKVLVLFDWSAYNGAHLTAAAAILLDSRAGTIVIFLAMGLLVLAFEHFSSLWDRTVYALFYRPEFQAVMIALTIWLAPLKNNGFIYFAF